MIHLCDSNVFLALAVGQHAHHSLAAEWFSSLADAETAVFCRVTRISFLRLLTQKIAPGYVPLSNAGAWSVLDRLVSDDAIGFATEPAGLETLWREWSALETASPKVWMDAYLAAFAAAGGMRLVTLDRDFQRFAPLGVDLRVLGAQARS